MLTITIPRTEMFDEQTNTFIEYKEQKINLEHSLVSLSKWESKYKKPFLSSDEKTDDESRYYIECMTLTQNVNKELYNNLSIQNFEEVAGYIDDSMTATTINDRTNKSNKKNSGAVTAEIIYYWMTSMNLPVEFQKWHLNRLLTLINVINVKNAPAKKRSRSEILSERRSLNEKRKASLNTKG